MRWITRKRGELPWQETRWIRIVGNADMSHHDIIVTHRIHVCYIWSHGSHQYTPFMLAYIPAPWILWVMLGGSKWWQWWWNFSAEWFSPSQPRPKSSSWNPSRAVAAVPRWTWAERCSECWRPCASQTLKRPGTSVVACQGLGSKSFAESWVRITLFTLW